MELLYIIVLSGAAVFGLYALWAFTLGGTLAGLDRERELGMFDVIIIGGGPAGASAALYTVRAGFSTLVFDNGGSALLKAHKIENYYGTGEISGEALYKNGVLAAEALGAKIMREQVVSVEWDGGFTVITGFGSYSARAVIFATGGSRLTPSIKGLAGREGAGVSYCAVCDGFFYRGQTVGVIGAGEYARHEAEYLKNIAKKVYVLTSGAQAEADFSEFEVIDARIDEIRGENGLEGAVINGELLPLDGIFIAVGVAGSAAFAKKLGALTEGERIAVNVNMATNVPGLFAAGDCTGGLLQVSKAVGEGAVAGTECVKFLRKA